MSLPHASASRFNLQLYLLSYAFDTVGDVSFSRVSSLNSVGRNANVPCLGNSPTVSASPQGHQ